MNGSNDRSSDTTRERASLTTAARLLSLQIPGLVKEDWENLRLTVSYTDVAPPATWMGYSVEWQERSDG